MSAFLVLEKAHGTTVLRNVVRNLYDMPVDSAFGHAGVALDQFDGAWREKAPTMMTDL